ncbi:5-demethoxyubiquinone hydroxylase, mitochondrial-like isoform X1 [Hydractinia symbiolongicarpus]|uniref:5-demethoxyubiquinone hydroxylase, mitochondrial-like isoform X1 n=1 Tax=Hydractinia symbiolongicarpus TaxID=13093 RepID=UPI002549EC93|nr:5-demethoxyubiquinone hydroxylase, mitochondrial-like isoform X1 [Hydractinia symbiolongicarpus]
MMNATKVFLTSTKNKIKFCRCYCVYNKNYSMRSNRLERRRQQQLISKILRVDHAGEVGADRIYAGQLAILRETSYGPVIQEMWDQEKEHVNKFRELLPKYKTRPTALLPLWNVAGFALGAGTALLGKEAAMACTIAVEETIGEHYDSQLRELLHEDPEKYKELLEVIQKFRDDELEHMETGYEYEGEKAPFYSSLKQAIQFGCRGAIWLSERI